MYLFATIIICLILLYLLMILPNLAHKREMTKYDGAKFAHRGYFTKDQKIPENSILAFKEALKHNLGIELDVRLTKDKQVVVFHDETLTRMCKDNRKVEHLTYAELRKLYLKHTSEKIPLLEDVLTLIDGRVPLLIELKLDTQDTILCNHVNDVLLGYRGDFLIQSFNPIAIRWFRLNAPNILRGQLSSKLDGPDHKQSAFCRFLVRYLLLNWYNKPDFISYKLADAEGNLSLSLIQNLFQVSVGVWTLRTEEAYNLGKANYNFIIFEKFKQN